MLKLTKDPSHKGYYKDEEGNLYVFRFGGRPIKVDDYREDKPKEDVQVEEVRVEENTVIDHRKSASKEENEKFLNEAEKEYRQREGEIKLEREKYNDHEVNHLESKQRDLVKEMNNTEERNAEKMIKDYEFNEEVKREEAKVEEELNRLFPDMKEAVQHEKDVIKEGKEAVLKYNQEFQLQSPVNDMERAQEYLTGDDMTQYLPDNLKEVITTVEWKLDDETNGHVEVKTKRELSKEEEKELSDWIQGQNSDGLGEGFEQQSFAESYFHPYSGEGPYTRGEAEEEIIRMIDEMDPSDYIDYMDESDIEAGIDNYIRKNGLEETDDEEIREGYRAEVMDEPYRYMDEFAIDNAKNEAIRDLDEYNVDGWYNMASMRTYNKEFQIEELVTDEEFDKMVKEEEKKFVKGLEGRQVKDLETGEVFNEVGNGQWRSEKDGYDYYLDFNSSNPDNPVYQDVATGKVINENRETRQKEEELNKNLTLMQRYSGTVQNLQELHPDWSLVKILEKIKKMEEE